MFGINGDVLVVLLNNRDGLEGIRFFPAQDLQGNFDPEHTSLSRSAYHSEYALHGFDQALADRKAKAGTAITSTDLCMCLDKRLEEFTQFLLRYTYSRILDGKTYPAVFRVRIEYSDC